MQPVCNDVTPIHLPVGDHKVHSGALEYKSLLIGEQSYVTVDFCEWLFSHESLVLKAFRFDATIMKFGEYSRLMPSETALPIHILSDNALFQTRELSVPILFGDFPNQALQTLLHRQQLTHLSLRPTKLQFQQAKEPTPLLIINAITEILSLKKRATDQAYNIKGILHQRIYRTIS